MKNQAHDVAEKLSPAVFARLTDQHRRCIFSAIEEVEQALGELKNRAADKDHDAALC